MPRGRKPLNRTIIEDNPALAQEASDPQVAAEATPIKSEMESRPSASNPRAARPKRTPINGYRNILTVEGQEPGWHYCFVNDYNVPKYEQGGYVFVDHDVVVGDRRIDSAGRTGGKVSLPVGNGVTAFLMRCRQEDYDAEIEALNQAPDEVEETMYASLNSKKDGQYGSVSIQHGRRK